MMRAAYFARGTPVAFEEKGTVRDARGFSSITKICSSLTANWTFRRPLMWQESASFAAMARMFATILSESENGGKQQAESPEWMPHSSICSSTAPT